jgi:hypothetical protein
MNIPANLSPWFIWQVQDASYGASSPAVEFYQPNPMIDGLLTVMEKFYQFADDFSMIPRYMAGNERLQGAARTASGLSMLMNAANKGLKGIVSNVDSYVLKPLLEKLYTHNMLYDPDETLKGDSQIVARGAISLMQQESLQLRRNEFLTATANPLDSQIVGIPGRAEVLREVAKGLELDVNKVIPPREALLGMQQAQQAQQMQQAAPNPNGVEPNPQQTNAMFNQIPRGAENG